MALLGKLSVREQPVGGDVAPWVNATGAPMNGRREATLLIHGYNNSQREADGSFESFSADLNGDSPATDFSVFGFYWPGDTHIKIISALSYPVELGPAKDSAKRLFEFLKGLSGPEGTPIVMRIVAHSLGNRLTLELLECFAKSMQATQVVIRSASLMAAAVPVGKAKAGGEFGAVIQALKTQVLYSTADRVLQLAFPIGETAALDGFFPQAVGRHGHPEVWSIPAQRMNYAHGDYWPGKESATAVAGFLGAPVHAMPTPNDVAEHQIPAPAQIGSRDLPPAGELIQTVSFG